MKKGFTLIEMLIVVALIATMMTIVLRLSSVSSAEVARNTTVLRLARLENCLSGYYAAYGNYPPVKLHNTRDIYQEADGHGVQSSGNVNNSIWGWDVDKFRKGDYDKTENDAWNQVEAACRAQPVGAECPFPSSTDSQDEARELSDGILRNLSSGKFKKYPSAGTARYKALSAGFDILQDNLGRFNGYENSTSWREVQIFKFGLLSFLLPRSQAMMGGNYQLFENFAQWQKNNTKPSDPLDGSERSWQDWNRVVQTVNEGTGSKKELARLECIAADAVCARWLPNLEGCCATYYSQVTFYGVDITDESEDSTRLFSLSEDEDSSPPSVNIYSPPGQEYRNQYILNQYTILDGWNREFYYYSPSPHQTYQIWSSGANGRTFPPWISMKKLTSDQVERVQAWVEDDIKGMSN